MLSEQRGSALVYVMLIGAMVAVGLYVARLQFDFTLFSHGRTAAEYAAHSLAVAGQEEARARLQDRNADLTQPSWTYQVPGGGAYSVSITRPTPDQRLVRSEGSVGGRSMNITRLYTFQPAARLQVPLFVGGDLQLGGLTRVEASLRSNGNLIFGSNTPLAPDVMLTAAGAITFGGAPCTSPQCRPFSPPLDLPLPTEAAVRQGAHEVVLTAANTRNGLFYIGGPSGTNRPGYAQNSSDQHPWDFRVHPSNVYIRSGDGGTYRVIFSTLIYAGSGTISTASANIRMEFEGGQTPIRRAASAPNSCIALLPFQTATVTSPNNFTLEGVMIANSLALGNNPTINGSLVVGTLDPSSSGSIKGLTLRSDPQILLHVPPQVPQAVDTYVVR